jgi:hypothetical protein
MSWRSRLEMSILPIRIFPPATSTNLNMARVSEDLLAPVLPTVPIFSPPLTQSEIPFSIKYLAKLKLSKMMSADCGQSGGWSHFL